MFIVTYILLKFQLDIKLWHIWYAHVLWGVIGNVLGEHLKKHLGVWLEHTPPFPQLPNPSPQNSKGIIIIIIISLNCKLSLLVGCMFLFPKLFVTIFNIRVWVRVHIVYGLNSSNLLFHSILCSFMDETRNNHCWCYNLPTTWVFQLCLQKKFPKVERSLFLSSKNKPPRLNWLIMTFDIYINRYIPIPFRKI
jgi:hypothetical protein